jgi:hypothetical protein
LWEGLGVACHLPPVLCHASCEIHFDTVLALRIRPGHSPAKKKLQQARDAVDAKAAAMRAQIDAAIEKAQQQQIIDAEKEKASLK